MRRVEPVPAAGLGLAVRRLLQAGRQMQATMAARLGLRVVDLQAIDHVVSSPDPLGPVELGQRLGLTSASATVLVDRLVTAGHLARQPHPYDGRRITLVATEHARNQVRRVLAPLLTDIAAVTAGLDEHDLARSLDLLRAVTEAMAEYPRSGRPEAGPPA